MQEQELYKPVKELLERLGFVVKAEVKDIDVFAMREDLTLAVELKTSINLKLIYQAIDRQKLADVVYLALPYSAIKSHKKNIRSFYNLLRRLELGLIIISNSKASIEIEAKPYDAKKSRQRNKNRRNQVIKEFKLLESDVNIGGIRGRRMTVYREQTIKVSLFIKNNGPSSPRSILKETGVEKTGSILQKNYYGWFYRVERGLYDLTHEGKCALETYEYNK